MSWRYRFTFFILVVFFVAVVGRLFYWQILKSSELSALARDQSSGIIKLLPERGEIKTSDGFPIAANKLSYLVFANPKEVKDKKNVANLLSSILDVNEASISSKLSKDLFWVSLKSSIDVSTKEQIDDLKLSGIGFEEGFNRFYPEASMSSHVLGFVGKDELGQDKGYFGLEGYYDRLLKGKEEYGIEIHDALGRPILSKTNTKSQNVRGSNLILNIDRVIQFLAERKLKEGIERYGATSGMVGIMEPRTGNILALASFPSFDEREFQKYDDNLYKNPFISDLYEPGSTFKPLVMAAALDSNVVNPQTQCSICGAPIIIGDYDIHTWNDKYYKNINMIDVITHSDNTGMVFVAQKLGIERMISFLKKFGIGSLTNIDLQGEALSTLRPKNLWYPVDLATTGFGQGISITPIELLRAFSSIANGGKIMEPHVVSAIQTTNGQKIQISPKVVDTPISEKTAKVMTEILVNAVEKGEASWASLKGYRIAGKTGTASIPVKGHYDPNQTIASFIGFAPANDPKFVMLVILNKPTTSIYGAETAAPIFFSIAKDILDYYGIPPNQ